MPRLRFLGFWGAWWIWVNFLIFPIWYFPWVFNYTFGIYAKNGSPPKSFLEYYMSLWPDGCYKINMKVLIQLPPLETLSGLDPRHVGKCPTIRHTVAAGQCHNCQGNGKYRHIGIKWKSIVYF